MRFMLRIKKYSYFDYEVNEALHLSPKEEEVVGIYFIRSGQNITITRMSSAKTSSFPILIPS
jgi:hypothetical protein